MADRPVVFSGMQPDGVLHLGNLLGALRPWVQEQSLYRNYFCVVDLHALTRQEPRDLAQKTREVAALYLAAGIDPEQSTLLVQSHVPEHAELAWILGCFTPMGWLERMTQFKDRSRKLSSERIGSGLFSYPVLMAADILLYQTDLVPVGEDQRQHLELTRNLALRVNRILGETFAIPRAKIGSVGARVMALDDPTSKMSKSADSEAGRIGLLDPPDQVRAKFRRATTDSGTEVDLERTSPGVQNLLEIYRSLTGAGEPDLAEVFQGKGYGRLKEVVAEVVIEALEPIQRRCHDLLKDPGALDQLLADGAARARASASATMAKVRQRLGMLPAV